MILFYDKQGAPIEDTLEWARLFGDWDYRLIGEYIDGDLRIVTVWTGIDREMWPDEGRATFSTAVFRGEELLEETYWNTLEEAEDGQKEALMRFMS